jgi:uncharacterized membrane protein
MKKRKYYLISLLLIFFAICSDFAGKSLNMSYTLGLAKKLQSRSADEQVKPLQENDTDRYRVLGNIFISQGLVLAVLFLIFTVFSIVKKEPAYYSVSIVLFSLFLFSYLTFV